MDKSWVTQEEKLIRLEMKRNNSFNFKDIKLKKLLLLLGFITIFSYANAEENEFKCPHCKESIRFTGGWFDTWTCKNDWCQYENYEGINYCALCGRGRYQ